MDAMLSAAGHETDDLPPRSTRYFIALSIYWFSNSLLWGALLHIGLQARLDGWFGEREVGYYMGILGAIGGIVGTVSQIVAGAFSDVSTHRFGRRRPFFIIGVAIGTVSLMLVGAAKSFWPLTGAMILVQVFTNLANGPFSAVIYDTVSRREQGKAAGFLGMARLMGDIGGVILGAMMLSEALASRIPALAGFDADQRFWLMMAFTGGLMALTMVVSCFTIRERPLQSAPEMTAWEILRRSFEVDIRGNKDFFWLSASRFITNLGFYIFLEYIYFFFADSLGVHDPKMTTMVLVVPVAVIGAISSQVSGALSDRRGSKPLLYFAQFIMAVGALVIAFAPNLTWVFIAALPAGVGYGVFTAVEFGLAFKLLPQQSAARYLGVWNASLVVPQVLGFPLGGFVGSSLAAISPGLGWRVDFALVSVCCVVGAYLLKFVHERRETASEMIVNA